MPDGLWERINGNREATQAVIRRAVKLTKEGIKQRIGDEWVIR